MDAYLYPIKVALFVFPFLALVLSVPFFILQYRKYGAFNFWRGVVLYSFIFYLLSAYFLITLPLPSRESVAALTTPKYNLIPFEFVRQFMTYNTIQWLHPGTYLHALRESSFIQPAFNILLTVPFGVFLRYYFKRSWQQVLVMTFSLSLFFELTQLSGLYGYYPRPYRLFDVDDLMLNTTGGMVGFWIAPVFISLFPTHEQMSTDAYQKGKRVSYSRRFVAIIVDFFLMNLALATFNQVDRVMHLPAWLRGDLVNDVMGVLIFFFLVPLIFKGQTFGKMLVRIKIVDEAGHQVKPVWLVIRQALLFGVVFPIFQLTSYFLGQTGIAPRSQVDQLLVLSGIFGVLSLIIVGHVGVSMLFRHDRLIYEELSKTKQISTLTPK